MSKFISTVKLQIRVGLPAALSVFRNYKYVLLAVIGVFLSSSFILWSLNLELVKYIFLEAPISFVSKLDFFAGVYRDIFTTYESPQAMGIIIFSTLFGINVALLTFVLRNKGFKDIPKKSGFGGMTLAVLSGGCIACGTSILAPILATFGATSGAFLRDLSLYLNWVGSILIIYSIVKLGLLIATIRASTN